MIYYLQRLIAFFRPPTSNNFEIPSPLLPYVTPFGSRVWGGYTSRSDVDLLARQDDDGQIFHVLRNLGIDYSTSQGYWSDTEKITFLYKSFRFEISCFDNRDYAIQYQTIQLVSSYFSSFPSSAGERPYRHYVFNHYRDFLFQGRKLPTSLHTHLYDRYPELLI